MQLRCCSEICSAAQVQKILQAHNYDTLMVEADAGEDFGMLTMQYLSQLDEERGILLAVCTEHYGEMTSSKYSSFWELKYAYDRDLAIMPLKVSKVYPPRPPFGADHPYDKKGTARGFVKSAMPSSTVYINCLDEPGEPGEHFLREFKKEYCLRALGFLCV